jgi:hypothetical protein
MFGVCLLGSPESLRAEDSSRSAPVSLELKKAPSPELLALKDLRKQLHAIFTGATLKRGTTAVYVVDADSGEQLYEVHGMPP